MFRVADARIFELERSRADPALQVRPDAAPELLPADQAQ